MFLIPRGNVYIFPETNMRVKKNGKKIEPPIYLPGFGVIKKKDWKSKLSIAV